MNNKFQNNIFMHKIIPRKQRLFITKTYNSNMNYQKGPLLNVINDYYFCTKGIGKINVYNNKNREFDEINNKNKNKSNSNKKTNNKGKYIGQLINGKREDRGIIKWDNGDIYNGEWKEDKKEFY